MRKRKSAISRPNGGSRKRKGLGARSPTFANGCPKRKSLSASSPCTEENAARAYYAWVVVASGPVRIARLGDAATIEKLFKDLVHHQENYADPHSAQRRKDG